MENGSLDSKILGEIRDYLRILAASAVKERAVRVLDSHDKAVIYEMLDGMTSILDIRESTRIAKSTISDWLQVYVYEGLASPPNEFHRNNKAFFTLAELGISLRRLKAKGVRQSRNRI